jgi:hypothetical protein
LKEFAISLNVFAGIPFGESEIEHFAAIEDAHASLRSAEAVDQPGEGTEGRDLKKTDTVCRCLEFPAVARSKRLIPGFSRSR